MRAQISVRTASIQAWILLALRSLFLAALLLVAASSGALSDTYIFLYAGWVLLTLLISISQMMGFHPGWLDWITVFLDLGFALGTIALTGYFQSPLWWSLLVGPVTLNLSRGIRWAVGFTFIGLLTATAFSVVQTDSVIPPLQPILLRSAALLIAAWLLSWTTDYTITRMITLERENQLKSNRVKERERSRARTFYRITAELSKSSEPDEILERALDLGAEALEIDAAVDGSVTSAFLRVEEDALRIASTRNMMSDDLNLLLHPISGLFEGVYDSGDPQICLDPREDPLISQIHGFNTSNVVLVIPLLTQQEPYGAFLHGHNDPGFFRPDQLDLVRAFTQQTMIALKSAWMYADLVREKERITDVQEEVRKKLARDLHDGPTQMMAAITMRMNFAQRLIDRDPASATKELIKLEDMARQTTKEIRHMLFTLRPLIVETRGLVAGLYQLADKMRDIHQQDVIVEADPMDTEDLDKVTQSVIFYIAEEAVNNARKHAEAEHTWIRLNRTNGLFILMVEDDGVGFNVGAVDADYAQRGSLGIVSMRERSILVNGSLHIESAEGEGTRVVLEVPLSGNDLDY